MPTLKIEKPEIEVKVKQWDHKANERAILNAAEVSKKKSFDLNYFDKFKEKWILKAGHTKLLENSFVGYIYKDSRSKNLYHIRDWNGLYQLLMKGREDRDIKGFYGFLRDFYEIYEDYRKNKNKVPYIIKKILFDYGLIKEYPRKSTCYENIFKYKDKPEMFQIKIKTNRFTAMQLRTHQSIGWICESTRMNDYSLDENCAICTIDEEIKKDSLWFRDMKTSFENYTARLDHFGRKKKTYEIAGRNLTEFRKNYIIGCGLKKDWLELCKKRIYTGAQHDAMMIAVMIGNTIINNDKSINIDPNKLLKQISKETKK